MTVNHAPRHMTFGRFDIAAFFCFFVYASGTVVIPVALVTLAKDLGFPLKSGGLTAGGALHLGRTLAIVASMLICGVVAGQWGKRRTLGVSLMLLPAGLCVSACAPSYGILLVALLAVGLGEGTVEGLATPFVLALHREESGRYINFAHAFWSVGVLVTVLVSGALLAAGVSWRLITTAVALTALVPVFLLLLPARSGHGYPEHPEPIHWRTVAGQARTILSLPRFWLFFGAMFVAGGGEFCLTYWSASYIQMNVDDSALSGGTGLACFAAGMVLGRTAWGYLIRQHRLKALIVFSALCGTALTFIFPMLENLYLLYLLLFLSGVATAPFWPSIQSYCADRLPGVDSTMLFILLSCAGIPGCGFFTWLMGYIGNQGGGLRQAFYLVPACYLTLALLIGTDWIQSCRQLRSAPSK